MTTFPGADQSTCPAGWAAAIRRQLDHLQDLAPAEWIADRAVHSLRRRRIQRNRRRRAAAWEILRSAGRLCATNECSTHDVAEGLYVLVTYAPYEEGDWCDYLVDRHGGVFEMPFELDGDTTAFVEMYPTRRARVPFAVRSAGAHFESNLEVLAR